MPVRRRHIALAALSLVVVWLTPSPALAVPNCTFTVSKGSVVVTATSDGDTVILSVGAGGEILMNGQTCRDLDGTTATVDNASSVRVDGGAGAQQVTIDLAGGIFGDVGFSFALGAGVADTMVVQGGTGGDTVIVGATSLAIGGQPSTHSGVEAVTLEGNAGPDRLSLAGLSPLDAPFAGVGTIRGGDGHDLLFGGLGPDSFTGGSGRDLLSYEGRIEDLQLTPDGVANDGAAGEGDNIENALETGSGGHGIDALLGGDGDDVIEATGLATGASDVDQFYCAPSNVGTNHPDVCGGPGNDLFPEPFLVAVSGGPDLDTADWSSWPGIVITCDSPARIALVEDDLEVQIGSDDEAVGDILCGGDGPNVLVGGLGDDRLDGGLGPDEMSGGGGVDRATYGSHDVGVVATLNGIADDGVAGEDLIHDDVENLWGGSGADHLIGNDEANVIHGEAGADILEGGGGRDTLEGGGGDDELSGGPGNDVLDGGRGADVLAGDAGRDTLEGGGEDDELSGGPDNDVLDGGEGADAMRGDEGVRDQATYEDRTRRVVVTLRAGDDDGEAGEGDNVADTIEWVIGGSGNDEFVSASRGPVAGIAADNVFVGNGGQDELKGGNGQDILNGGDGNDELFGGAGNDVLRGHGNADLLKGEGGDDDLFAEDGISDEVKGGPGFDEAHVDGVDDVSSCELLL